MTNNVDTEKAIEYFASKPEVFKTLLHEVANTPNYGFVVSPAMKNTANTIRNHMAPFLNGEMTDEDVCDAFWRMAYVWADKRSAVTGFVA